MNVQIPLIVSTLCQRLALGTYIIAMLAAWLFGYATDLALICGISLVLFCVGVIGSMAHLGRPARLLYSFANWKSHLTQEGLIAPFVGLFLFVIFVDGKLFKLPEFLISADKVLCFLFSLLFIWRTGLVYKLKTRPAWNTPLVTINFFLSTFAIGCTTLYLWAMLWAEPMAATFYLASLAVLVVMFVCQGFYLYRSSTLQYGVAVVPSAPEFKPVVYAWFLTGVAGTALVVLVVYLYGHSVLAATILASLNLLSLGIWRAYFFMAGKAVVYFPMYKCRMSTNF